VRPLFLKYDRYIECRLCPHFCKIAPGKTGICGARKNTGDTIELITYGVTSGYSTDPVEKKPLYHFFPGHSILSVGSYGCNMKCDFCQNWHISQAFPGKMVPDTDPGKLAAEAASSSGNIGLAFTYNEPVIWFEFVRDTAIKIKDINRDPLNELLEVIDAFNVDLKAFSDSFYKKLTGTEIEPVRESLKEIAMAGKHLEITTLIIPGKNDSVAGMEDECRWIADELGEVTPLHLSRYYPVYKRNDPPTSQEKLEELYETAKRYLKNVYLGNVAGSRGQDSFCSSCGTIVTKRSGYAIKLLNLSANGKCTKCGNQVYRYFTFDSRGGR
jgi:pyruvate formate lyase activating enzyme